MRILFLHNNCPAQYRYLAPYLAQDPNNTVVFGTMNQKVRLPNIRHVYYAPKRYSHEKTHHYLHNAENAVLHGQAVYLMARELKREGFIPDVVCAHSGWGPPHFIHDIFENAAVLTYFEWYYNFHGGDYGFLPEDPNTEDARLKLRMKNTAINFDLIDCNHGITPTKWQNSQFPRIFQDKLTVLHDGVETDFMAPSDTPIGALTLKNTTLTPDNEIITYVARGMEPLRGFPQFLKAIEIVQQQRPNCHTIIAGEDRVAYGKQLPEGQSYKQNLLKELSLDLNRIHFTNLASYGVLRHIFHLSSVHVYLTAPFVLSWSMLEAMSCECCVIGSDTPPVREFIQHEKNGFLTDFFDVDSLAKKINTVLDQQDQLHDIRKAARKAILKSYQAKDILPKQVALIQSLVKQ